MRLEPFALERMQSVWENRVAWNLSESGVHPLRVEELAETEDDRAAVLAEHLSYSQTNGTAGLRTAIAALYPGASAAEVEVTNGGSEANFITLCRLLEPGDEFVMMMPNYMQMRGLARALGAIVRPWPLAGGDAGSRWRPDLPLLESLVSPKTKLIAICNPNNPTGARFTASELNDISRIAARAGAWVISDEIYRGAERDGVETPTFWGRYDRAIVTSGLSKAYGLPGLRIGWVVAPPSLVEELWGVHDYTTIAPGTINDRLARVALAPARRPVILARTRGIVGANYPVVRRWIEKRAPKLEHTPPDAGAIVFVRYHHAVNSTVLAERLRNEQSVLVVPGDHFEMDGYLRIGFGHDPAHLLSALDLMGEILDGIE
jgi:aspartate/methionine/tyrosine aminotransferase